MCYLSDTFNIDMSKPIELFFWSSSKILATSKPLLVLLFHTWFKIVWIFCNNLSCFFSIYFTTNRCISLTFSIKKMDLLFVFARKIWHFLNLVRWDSTKVELLIAMKSFIQEISKRIHRKNQSLLNQDILSLLHLYSLPYLPLSRLSLQQLACCLVTCLILILWGFRMPTYLLLNVQSWDQRSLTFLFLFFEKKYQFINLVNLSMNSNHHPKRNNKYLHSE